MSVMSVVSFTYKQNIILSQTQLDDIAHEQTIICRQLFASHVVALSQNNERTISIECPMKVFKHTPNVL